MDEVKSFLAVVLIISTLLLGIGSCVVFLDLSDKTTCKAQNDGADFFNGPAYQLNCKSMGVATQCTVGRAWPLHRFPAFHIVAKEIKIRCE